MNKYTEGRLTSKPTSVDEAIFLRKFGESWHEIAHRIGVQSLVSLSRSLRRRGYKTLAAEAYSANFWCPEHYERNGWWYA